MNTLNTLQTPGLSAPVPNSLLGSVLQRAKECHSLINEIDGAADRMIGTMPPRPEGQLSAVPNGSVGEIASCVDSLFDRLAVLRDRLSNVG